MNKDDSKTLYLLVGFDNKTGTVYFKDTPSVFQLFCQSVENLMNNFVVVVTFTPVQNILQKQSGSNLSCILYEISPSTNIKILSKIPLNWRLPIDFD